MDSVIENATEITSTDRGKGEGTLLRMNIPTY